MILRIASKFPSFATYSSVADYLNFRLLMYLYYNYTVCDIILSFFHNMIYIIYRNCSMAFRFPHVCCQLLAAPHICVPRRSLIILYFLPTPTQQQQQQRCYGYYSTTYLPAIRRAKNYQLLFIHFFTNGQQYNNIIIYIYIRYLFNIYLYLPPRVDGPMVFGQPRHYRCC